MNQPEPSIVPTAPWDPAELEGRTCNACACYFESVNPEDPKQFQGFCRRSPADMQKVRGQVPRLDLKGKPVIKDGVPVMNTAEIIGFLYRPTQREGTCFDGWREKGTLPGAGNSRRDLELLKATIERAIAEMSHPVS
jgi:hypothetical protein